MRKIKDLKEINMEREKINLDEELAICQMRTISVCSEYGFSYTNIKEVLMDLDLISKEYAELAFQEDLLNIASIIFEEIKRNKTK